MAFRFLKQKENLLESLKMGENSGEQSIGMDTINKVKDADKKVDNTNYIKVTKK